MTLSLGIRLLDRLAETCASGLDGADGRAYAFPGPAELAGRTPDELRALGFSRQKALAIIELARAMALHRLDVDGLEHQDDATVMARLRALRGVGRWTAEYVLLRGLGRLHVFPGDDVGARNNLQRWLGLLDPLDYDGVRRALARWAPFQGLVYLHLGRAPTSAGRPRWRSPPTRSTACWSSDARAASASPDSRRGWGHCVQAPDPRTMVRLAERGENPR